MALIISLIGIPSNLVVIYLFCREKKLKTASNCILLSLCLSDLLMLATNCPMTIIANFMGHWIFGIYGCRFYGFFGCFFGLTSINCMAFVAFDRWYQISQSSRMKKLTMSITLLLIAGIWIYCLLWSILPFFGINEFVLEGIHTSCSVNFLSQDFKYKIYNKLLFVFCFTLPLLAIGMSYGGIYVILRRKRNAKPLILKLKKVKSKDVLNKNPDRDSKTTKIALYLLSGYLFAWSPYATIYLMGMFGYGRLITPLVSAIPAICAKTSAAYNPFIYLGSHKLFQQAFIQHFRSIASAVSERFPCTTIKTFQKHSGYMIEGGCTTLPNSFSLNILDMQKDGPNLTNVHRLKNVKNCKASKMQRQRKNNLLSVPKHYRISMHSSANEETYV